MNGRRTPLSSYVTTNALLNCTFSLASVGSHVVLYLSITPKRQVAFKEIHAGRGRVPLIDDSA